MRRREPARVLGPYQERGRWRIVVVENGTRRSVFVPTEAEALRLKREFSRDIQSAGQGERTVRSAIDAFLSQHIATGRALPTTCDYYRNRLLSLFGPFLDRELSEVTERRATALYQRQVERQHGGHALAAATHHSYLLVGKLLFRWAVSRSYVKENPFAKVQPLGKVRSGKAQLRIDEARAFTEAALRLFMERGDQLALGALTALLLGLRASEVVSRTVRDLDDGGRILWIDAGKTRNARRHLKVPEALRPHLLTLATGQQPNRYLFGTSKSGEPKRRHSLYRAVHRVCAAAGVPRVCSHSLRGLYATLAVESGAVSEQVAASLGHGSFAITQKHYAQESAVRGAQSQRVIGLLARSPDAPSAEQLLRTLPEATLTELLSLIQAKHPEGDRE